MGFTRHLEQKELYVPIVSLPLVVAATDRSCWGVNMMMEGAPSCRHADFPR
jgi:hypothetical protein